MSHDPFIMFYEHLYISVLLVAAIAVMIVFFLATFLFIEKILSKFYSNTYGGVIESVLSEGYVRKGGTNSKVSQVKQRPAAPKGLKRKSKNKKV